MRAILQRVQRASVTVEGERVGAVGSGLLVLLGVAPGDGDAEVRWLADKVANLRIHPDEEGHMNRSLLDLGQAALVVSQFTVYADCRRGRRPSFVGAAAPDVAEPLVVRFCEALRAVGVHDVQQGVFGAHMMVELVNDGPVTIVVDTP